MFWFRLNTNGAWLLNRTAVFVYDVNTALRIKSIDGANYNFFVALVYLRSNSHPLQKSWFLKYKNFILNYASGITTYGTIWTLANLHLISQCFQTSYNSLNPVWLGAQKQLVIVCISLSWTVPLNDFCTAFLFPLKLI